MKLLRNDLTSADFNKGVVAAIGNFDGVHTGHQNLIKLLRAKANSLNLPLLLILFEPQPREYFQNDKAPPRISSLREKLEVFKQCQVDFVYCIKFNSVFALTSAHDFACTWLFSKLRVKHLLSGVDFRFGKDREGTVSLLQTLGSQYGCDVQIAPDFHNVNEKVSSTKIREALARGNLKLAAQYLGRYYSLCGRVIHGDGRARQWGTPTANINLQRPALPLKGVFAVQVLLNSQTINGVANIGTRPTVDGTRNSLEVHLFDFNQSIYGKMVKVSFLHKLRDEIKFTSVDALIAQIHNDIEAANAYFNLLTCTWG